MRPPPLACSVRGCGQPLSRRERVYTCARGHSHDVSRSGYVNLLQPQDRKSAEPGDARAAVEARAALEEAGVGRALVEAVAHRIDALALPQDAVVVDLGCGTGLALEAVTRDRALVAVGIDVSVAAMTYAARRRPGPTWVVANADRTLPLLHGQVNVVMSLHARRNPAEVARVLAPGGVLIMAVPAPDDLIQVRERLLGTGLERDRVAPLVADHQPLFTVCDQFRVSDQRRLDREALQALLRATYRGARHRTAEAVAALTDLDVTMASEVCVFTPAAEPRPPET